MNRQAGSAITESLVGLLALIPAFVAMDYLGRLADMDRSTTAAARYAAWQSLAGNTSDARRQLAIEDRVFGNDHAPLVAVDQLRRAGPSRNPLWQDPTGALRVADNRQRSTPPDGDLARLPAAGRAVRGLAHGDSMPSIASFVGLSKAMLDLKRSGLRGDRIRVRAQPRLEAGENRPPLTLTAAGGLSTRTWQATTDAEYERRMQQIVASEPVDALSTPAQILGRFFVFKEGRDAKATDFVPPSARLPRRR